MFSSSIKSIFIAGTVALGTLVAASSSAQAGSHGGIYFEGPGISVGFGDRHYRDRRWDRGDRWDRPRFRHRTCKPRKALRKARNRGLRRAHIVRVGYRGVIVAGRKWGDRVVIGFGRHRSCPVRFVRAR